MSKPKKIKPVQGSPSNESFLLESQIKVPQRLKMLILSGSSLARSDFLFIMKCKNLIKLDLSSNGLVRFPRQFTLTGLSKLSFLHLHNNQFRNIEDLKPVFETTNLIQLTLQQNPLPINPRIEHFILNVLRKLRMINDRIIYEEERMPDIMVDRPTIRLEFDDFLPQEKVQDEKYYIWLLEVQFKLIEYRWVHANPIVRVQRLWRKYWKNKTDKVVRPMKYIKKFKEPLEEIQKKHVNPLLVEVFKQWKQYSQSLGRIRKHLKKENKMYMAQPLDSYRRQLRNQRVKHIVSAFTQKIRQRIKVKKAVAVFCRFLTPKVIMFNSDYCFYNVSGIKQSGRMMFNKNQKHLLLNFVELVRRSSGMTTVPQFSIEECKSYVAVRQLQQERLNLKRGDGPYNIMIYPSMRCIFLKNKKPNYRKLKKTTVNISQLGYLTKKNAQLTEAERTRSNTKYERLCRYIENEYYSSLLEFRCTNQQLFRDVLRLIYYHNSGSCKFQKFTKNTEALSFLDNYEENFIFYFDRILRRTTAAVHIQKCWKRYWNNKTCKQTLYVQIQRNRATQKIQKFARSQKFNHRINFDLTLSSYLRDIDSSGLYLQMEVYLELKKFLSKTPLYDKLASWMNFTEKDVFLTWEYPRSPFFPKTQEKFSGDNIAPGNSIAPCDIYALLHINANMYIATDGTRKFVHFQYKNAQTARKRAAFIALMTYRYKTGFFLRLFSKEQLTDQSYMQRYSERMQLVHNYKLPFQCKNLKEKAVATEPQPVISNNASKSSSRNEFIVVVDYFQQENINAQPIKLTQKFSVKMPHDGSQSRLSNHVPRLEDVQQQETIKNETQQMVSSLRKNFQKRLSFYDITIEYPEGKKMRATSNKASSESGADQESGPKEQYQRSPAMSQADWLRQTHRNAQKQRQEHSVRMHDCQQRSKQYLNRMRKLHTQQKTRNMNLKFIKQSEHIATNRLKVERIDEIKKQMRQTKTAQEEHQNSFIQKGNFLIKQEVKMRKVRDTYYQEQRKRQSVSKASDSSRGQPVYSTQNIRPRNLGSRISDEQEKSVIQKDKESAANNKGDKRRSSVQTPNLTVRSNKEVKQEFQQQSIHQAINPFTEDLYKLARKRQKIIHAVFPQEFYAINKKNGQFGLPRIDKS